MKVRALKSFSGVVSMYAGEVRDIKVQDILDDLTSARYIEPVAPKGRVRDESKRDNT